MFCDNLRDRMDVLGMTAKDVANAMERGGFVFRRAKQPHRIVESWKSKTRPYHPELLAAVALAKALSTTVEELVDGDSGVEYIREWARRDGKVWQAPPHIADIVGGLSLLDTRELDIIRGAVGAAVSVKKGKGNGTDGSLM
jgi:predicted RNA binding protein YcfA (HicA-like mRNA interferase family)